MDAIPVGTAVWYSGSLSYGRVRRYVITRHDRPRDDVPDPEVHYPDGVAYEIWPEDVKPRFGNRGCMVYQVRRGSLEMAGERRYHLFDGSDEAEMTQAEAVQRGEDVRTSDGLPPLVLDESAWSGTHPHEQGWPCYTSCPVRDDQ